MADYWKSNDRKFCDFCKCWISDNKASVSFHENGKRHKMNVAKRITEISRNSTKSEKERQKMDAEIRKMEEAAMLSYAKDIHSRGDLTARTVGAVIDVKTVMPQTSNLAANSNSINSRYRQIDPMRLPGSDDEDEVRVSIKKVEPEVIPNASLWVEGKSDEGHTYYWNVKTNESVWETPKEGYMSWEDYQRINDLAIKQQEINEANEAKNFRENANEEVARFNRERLKFFRKTETPAEKEAKRLEQEQRQSYKTESEAGTQEIGAWQVVETKPPAPQIDWELPKVENKYPIAPAVSNISNYEPPVKRFKEKTIESIDPEIASGTSASFKKRKFAAKGNARKRLEDD